MELAVTRVSLEDRCKISSSPGHAEGAPADRALLKQTELAVTYVIMARGYEGDETSQLVRDLNCIPVFPPESNRREPWEYGRQRYKQRNEVERIFHRLKGFRRILSWLNKLDVVFNFYLLCVDHICAA